MSGEVHHKEGRDLVRAIRVSAYPGKQLFVVVIISVWGTYEKNVPPNSHSPITYTGAQTHSLKLHQFPVTGVLFLRNRILFVTIVSFNNCFKKVIVSCRKPDFLGFWREWPSISWSGVEGEEGASCSTEGGRNREKADHTAGKVLI